MTTESSTTEFNRLNPTGATAERTSTTDVAKDEATGVASSASQAGQHVAGVAKDQASNVAAEAGRQAKDVIGQARAELSQQAGQQQQRVAEGLHSIGTELNTMADRSEDPGLATDLARQAASKVHEVAWWLEKREPNGLLDEVKTFARRRPGAFLAIALGAGLAAGRLTRGLKDESTSSSASTTRGTGTNWDERRPGTPDATGTARTVGTTGTPGTTGTETVPGYSPPAPAVTVVEPVVPAEQIVERPYTEQPYAERPYAEGTERPYAEGTKPPYSEETRP